MAQSKIYWRLNIQSQGGLSETTDTLKYELSELRLHGLNHFKPYVNMIPDEPKKMFKNKSKRENEAFIGRQA